MRNYIIRHYVIDRIRDIILFENYKMAKITAIFVGIFKGFFVKL